MRGTLWTKMGGLLTNLAVSTVRHYEMPELEKFDILPIEFEATWF